MEIPDFAKTELWVVNNTLSERYDHTIDIQLADSELRLDMTSTELTSCPTIFWQVDDCSFVICKTAESRYMCQFYYRGYQQFGTGADNYGDIGDCAMALLKTQEDYMQQQ